MLLERAAIGAAGVAAGGALDPVGAAVAQGGPSSINAFGTVVVTTEALTVKPLTEVLRRLNSVPAGRPGGVRACLRAEVDQFRTHRLGRTT